MGKNMSDSPNNELYRALWQFLDSQGLEDQESRAIVAFALADGSYRFSFADPLDVLLGVVNESGGYS